MKVKILASILVIIGLLQSFGHVFKSETIKQLGLITVASPLPIVFTEQKGLETFALDFTLEYTQDAKQKHLKITPELYAMLDKPYQYRNVLGAAISYGPVLPKPLVDSVLHYAFVEPAVVSEAFGLGKLKEAKLILKTKTKNVHRTFILPIGEAQ